MMDSPIGVEPSWEEGAARLYDSIIRRDETKAAMTMLELCRSETIPYWEFFRWDRSKNDLRAIWPAGPSSSKDLLEQHVKQLEKGEVVVDNRGSESSELKAVGLDLPRTILVPLSYDSQLLGVLHGRSSFGYSECLDRVEALRPLLRFLSQTWYLVGLLDDRERLVYTDPLTRLYNAEYLVHFLEAELARCGRYNRSAAIAFIDVDWFKNVNDAHGHLSGSQVLRELGELLDKRVREADVVVRYGGDEFVVVLTETGVEGALEMAERLRNCVETYTFGSHMGKSLRLTISTGVSVFPQHGKEVADLIHSADVAMYVAKQSSRNCTKMAVC